MTTRVIQRRLAERAEQLLRESQCGVRRNHGCIDQVFSLRILAEKAREFNTPLYLAFEDLRKAYDSVNHDALWMVLQEKYSAPRHKCPIFVNQHKKLSGARTKLIRIISMPDAVSG